MFLFYAQLVATVALLTDIVDKNFVSYVSGVGWRFISLNTKIQEDPSLFYFMFGHITIYSLHWNFVMVHSRYKNLASLYPVQFYCYRCIQCTNFHCPTGSKYISA